MNKNFTMWYELNAITKEIEHQTNLHNIGNVMFLHHLQDQRKKTLESTYQECRDLIISEIQADLHGRTYKVEKDISHDLVFEVSFKLSFVEYISLMCLDFRLDCEGEDISQFIIDYKRLESEINEYLFNLT